MHVTVEFFLSKIDISFHSSIGNGRKTVVASNADDDRTVNKMAGCERCYAVVCPHAEVRMVRDAHLG